MDERKVTDKELAEAFSVAKEEPVKLKKELKEAKKPKKTNKKKVWGIAVFILGLLTLAGGVTFLLITLLKGPGVRDAEYLVEVGAWEREGEPTVIWNFTEIGKGTLTTNFHINDYDFIWRIDGDTLKIETDWLYDLNNEYTYKLDQGAKTLTVTRDDEQYVFIPSSTPSDVEPDSEK